MAFLDCFDVSKSFLLDGQQLPVLADITFSVEQNEVIALVGQSGCGKSTLLRILAGLIKPDTGQVTLEGQPMTGPSQKLSILFQNYTVFPWMTVQGNVEAGLLSSGLSVVERKHKAREYLELVGLLEFARALPMTLSGGMQQRVALARTYAANPKVLLMDEPFGALDALTRREMQQQLLRINSEEHKTVIFVTHDIDEAILLASRILVLSIRPAGIVEVFERKGFPDRAVLHQRIAATLDAVVTSRQKQYG